MDDTRTTEKSAAYYVVNSVSRNKERSTIPEISVFEPPPGGGTINKNQVIPTVSKKKNPVPSQLPIPVARPNNFRYFSPFQSPTVAFHSPSTAPIVLNGKKSPFAKYNSVKSKSGKSKTDKPLVIKKQIIPTELHVVPKPRVSFQQESKKPSEVKPSRKKYCRKLKNSMKRIDSYPHTSPYQFMPYFQHPSATTRNFENNSSKAMLNYYNQRSQPYFVPTYFNPYQQPLPSYPPLPDIAEPELPPVPPRLYSLISKLESQTDPDTIPTNSKDHNVVANRTGTRSISNAQDVNDTLHDPFQSPQAQPNPGDYPIISLPKYPQAHTPPQKPLVPLLSPGGVILNALKSPTPKYFQPNSPQVPVPKLRLTGLTSAPPPPVSSVVPRLLHPTLVPLDGFHPNNVIQEHLPPRPGLMQSEFLKRISPMQLNSSETKGPFHLQNIFPTSNAKLSKPPQPSETSLGVFITLPPVPSSPTAPSTSYSPRRPPGEF